MLYSVLFYQKNRFKNLNFVRYYRTKNAKFVRWWRTKSAFSFCFFFVSVNYFFALLNYFLVLFHKKEKKHFALLKLKIKNINYQKSLLTLICQNTILNYYLRRVITLLCLLVIVHLYGDLFLVYLQNFISIKFCEILNKFNLKGTY